VNTGRYSVLLVEDDLPATELAHRAAVEFCPEINLTVVGGGDAVLDWLSASIAKKEQMPHIILMDMKLPKLDGLAVLRKLRMHAATRDIPIVAFSAEYTQADVLMSYQVGRIRLWPSRLILSSSPDFSASSWHTGCNRASASWLLLRGRAQRGGPDRYSVYTRCFDNLLVNP